MRKFDRFDQSAALAPFYSSIFDLDSIKKTAPLRNDMEAKLEGLHSCSCHNTNSVVTSVISQRSPSERIANQLDWLAKPSPFSTDAQS